MGTKLVDETHMGERSVGVKKKTYVGKNQSDKHMGERSVAYGSKGCE